MNDSISNFTVPILIICFNRPQHVNRQIEALQAVQPKHIFLSCDGPRSGSDDLEKSRKVIALYRKGINWDCKIELRISEENLGCSKGPISAMKWFFGSVAEGIILEDDIIPSPDFFWFAKEMLAAYRNNKRIISINGCNFGYSKPNMSYFFARIFNMWGWATWADRFNAIDFELNHWRQLRYKKLEVIRLFFHDFLKADFAYLKKWYYIWNKTISAESVTWWDYQLIYHQLQFKLLSIVPSSNLIENFGFEEDATHTRNTDHFMKSVPTNQLEIPLQHPRDIIPDKHFETEYIKDKWFKQ